jgi:hypothetical protein
MSADATEAFHELTLIQNRVGETEQRIEQLTATIDERVANAPAQPPPRASNAPGPETVNVPTDLLVALQTSGPDDPQAHASAFRQFSQAFAQRSLVSLNVLAEDRRRFTAYTAWNPWQRKQHELEFERETLRNQQRALSAQLAYLADHVQFSNAIAGGLMGRLAFLTSPPPVPEDGF